MFDNLRADLERVRQDRQRTIKGGLWKHSMLLEYLRALLALTTWSVIAYRFSNWAYHLKTPVFRQLMNLTAVVFQRWVELWTACHICRDAEIGPGLLIHSPYALLIGPAKIGKNCTVGSGVLITGGAKGVGDNVWFGPGAKVIGDTRIGNNVVVVANSLVVSDVSDGQTVMGVPARVSISGGVPRRFKTKLDEPEQKAPEAVSSAAS
jgi:serine O-acetyltransferase